MLSLGQFKLTDPQSMISQCQLLIYYGDSLYENQEYKRAEVNWNPVWCEILNNLLSLIKPGGVSMIESQQTRVCLKIYILYNSHIDPGQTKTRIPCFWQRTFAWMLCIVTSLFLSMEYGLYGLLYSNSLVNF